MGALAIAYAGAGAVGCSATCPAFAPVADDDAEIAFLSEAEQAAFCREQATFVYNYSSRGEHARSTCLLLALAGGDVSAPERTVTDAMSCEAYLIDCLADPPPWAWVYSCELPVAGVDPGEIHETVEHRRECVTHSVCVLWPNLSRELDCSLFGDEESVGEIFRRYRVNDFCRVPVSI